MKKSVFPTPAWWLLGAVAVVALAALAVYHLGRSTSQDARENPSVLPGQRDSSSAGQASRRPAVTFQEVGAETGITFQHTDGSSGRRYIVEAMSTGLATFDYDQDGLIDIYFPNGAPLPGAKFDERPRHALYRNLGGWRFQDVTESVGLICTAYTVGISIGDYDNNGWPDIYLENFGPNILYHNEQGTFTDVTDQAGVAGTTSGGVLARKVGAGACFLDFDGDGRLDLYAGTYMELDLSTHVPWMSGELPSYPPPVHYPGVPDTLYRNSGDGSFTDVSEQSGIGACAGRCMGVIAADYDDDGDTDLFACNDVQENFLFRNNGRGEFQQVGLMGGVAFDHNAASVANMGVDCGDLDNDGRLDFYTTNYRDSLPMLLRNLGRGMFEYATRTTNGGAGCLPHVNWGCGLVDFDNDGHKDIFVANGHTEDNIELRDAAASYRANDVVLRNSGDGTFRDISEACGVQAADVQASRGVAFDDLDNDGDIDIVVLNSRERPTLWKNTLIESGSVNHWLQISLQGVKTNRGGVGARVTVVAGDLTLVDEIHAGRGYQSHWGSRLHFGLGAQERVDRIEVRWIGGGLDIVEDVAVDQWITITEGVNNQPL